MQQLLTGQRRLAGFQRDWSIKWLGEIGSFSKGLGIRKDEVVADGIPCIRYGEIYTRHNDYIRAFHSFIPAEIAEQSHRLRKGTCFLPALAKRPRRLENASRFWARWKPTRVVTS